MSPLVRRGLAPLSFVRLVAQADDLKPGSRLPVRLWLHRTRAWDYLGNGRWRARRGTQVRTMLEAAQVQAAADAQAYLEPLGFWLSVGWMWPDGTWGGAHRVRRGIRECSLTEALEVVERETRAAA